MRPFVAAIAELACSNNSLAGRIAPAPATAIQCRNLRRDGFEVKISRANCSPFGRSTATAAFAAPVLGRLIKVPFLQPAANLHRPFAAMQSHTVDWTTATSAMYSARRLQFLIFAVGMEDTDVRRRKGLRSEFRRCGTRSAIHRTGIH